MKEHLLAKINWVKSFCGESDTAGVCSGDSGSAFYVQIGDRFYLKGLLSSSISSRKCSEKTIALYSHVVDYVEFIEVDKVLFF